MGSGRKVSQTQHGDVLRVLGLSGPGGPFVVPLAPMSSLPSPACSPGGVNKTLKAVGLRWGVGKFRRVGGDFFGKLVFLELRKLLHCVLLWCLILAPVKRRGASVTTYQCERCRLWFAELLVSRTVFSDQKPLFGKSRSNKTVPK